MANYLYDHDSIEDSHEAFVCDGTILRSPDVDALMRGICLKPRGHSTPPRR